eukprot:364062-Chlamydomonas_euryale.AAC.1
MTYTFQTWQRPGARCSHFAAPRCTPSTLGSAHTHTFHASQHPHATPTAAHVLHLLRTPPQLGWASPVLVKGLRVRDALGVEEGGAPLVSIESISCSAGLVDIARAAGGAEQQQQRQRQRATQDSAPCVPLLIEGAEVRRGRGAGVAWVLRSACVAESKPACVQNGRKKYLHGRRLPGGITRC